MDFLIERYREHDLFVQAHKSTSSDSRYLGSFIASKDGANVAQVTIDVDFDSATDAKDFTLQTARECVDEMLTA